LHIVCELDFIPDIYGWIGLDISLITKGEVFIR